MRVIFKSANVDIDIDIDIYNDNDNDSDGHQQVTDFDRRFYEQRCSDCAWRRWGHCSGPFGPCSGRGRGPSNARRHWAAWGSTHQPYAPRQQRRRHSSRVGDCSRRFHRELCVSSTPPTGVPAEWQRTCVGKICVSWYDWLCHDFPVEKQFFFQKSYTELSCKIEVCTTGKIICIKPFQIYQIYQIYIELKYNN